MRDDLWTSTRSNAIVKCKGKTETENETKTKNETEIEEDDEEDEVRVCVREERIFMYVDENQNNATYHISHSDPR